MKTEVQTSKSYTGLIWALSIIVPALVAVLIFAPQKLEGAGDWVYVLPHLNAALNSITSVVLILGLFFILRKNIAAHKTMMSIAFGLGSLFLISYVIYHAAADSTIFGDVNGNGVLEEAEKTGGIMFQRGVYVIILLSHIVLAAIVVPFVLFAFYFALTNRVEKHKKIVKFTFPIWLYVSITGVIVYLMISPYYVH
ncbi:putative membrane protein YozB [Marivirga lumbricoides]|uniref:Membrane protein YozB n=1 Tax=Marivirga lumbricoides TaxID=1046115 RepID=A0ABQ1LFS1_9BACT|nr:putative membrane protein YozB [Marivirga lumbricoides]